LHAYQLWQEKRSTIEKLSKNFLQGAVAADHAHALLVIQHNQDKEEEGEENEEEEDHQENEAQEEEKDHKEDEKAHE
jgi:hypothetical protein